MDLHHDPRAGRFLVQSDDLVLRAGPVCLAMRLGGRDTQQDAALVTGDVWAIADGMGGHRDGAIAARLALAALGDIVDGPLGAARLVDAFACAAAAVDALAEPGEFRPPGTTLVAVALADDGSGVVGAWAGDARAYRAARTEGWIEQLTDDHTSPLGGLESCLGGGAGPLRVGTFRVEAGRGEGVLLCSDGVWGATRLETGVLDEPGATRPGVGDERARPDGRAALLGGGLEALMAAAADSSDNCTALWLDVDALVAQRGLRP